MPLKNADKRRAYDRKRNRLRREALRDWFPKGRRTAIRTGAATRGAFKAKAWTNRISNATIKAIRGAVADGESIASLARAYGISYGYTWEIAREKVRRTGHGVQGLL